MKRIVILLALAALCISAQAIPARRGALTLTQPDGTTITAYLHGDAFFHYYTNATGDMLVQDTEGFYQATTLPSAEELEVRRMNSPRRIAMRQAGSTLNLAPRGLIILVNFKNLAFKTAVSEIDSMINGQNYTRRYTGYDDYGQRTTITSSGSARQYFRETSFGQYKPDFDVVGPITLSNDYSYYGGNDSQGNDKKPEQMVKEACQLVDDSVDFTLYDNNNDGKVDFVYILYAGYGESDGAGSDYIWPHNYHLTYSGVNCVVDDKKVDNYACSNELDYSSKKHEGIGTFCHEFSHVLGLPDLYATTSNATHKTLGSWDILDYGPYNNDGNTPPHYSAYERFFMGWLTPTLITEACEVQLPALGTSNAAAILTESGTHNLIGTNPKPATFYILENRQKNGWDKHLPGHGMLVTKVTYNQNKWDGNTVNNNSSSMGVDIIEADGDAPSSESSGTGYLGKLGDAYPAGADSFTALAAYQVTNIEEEGGYIFFQLNGGGETILLAVEDAGQVQSATKKIIRDGRLLIEYNGDYYDLLGNKQ